MRTLRDIVYIYKENKCVIATDIATIEAIQKKLDDLNKKYQNEVVRSVIEKQLTKEALRLESEITYLFEENEKIAALLRNQLSVHDYKLIEMIAFNDVGYERAAKALGRSGLEVAQSVKNTYFRLLRNLKEETVEYK